METDQRQAGSQQTSLTQLGLRKSNVSLRMSLISISCVDALPGDKGDTQLLADVIHGWHMDTAFDLGTCAYNTSQSLLHQ